LCPEIDEFLTGEEEQQLFAQLKKAKPHSLRAGLSDLVLRLSACLRNPLLTPYFGDMVNTFEYTNDLLEKLNGTVSNEIREATAQASRVTDNARAAMNQRYAGLEFHPEILAHSYAPLLCDIRSIV